MSSCNVYAIFYLLIRSGFLIFECIRTIFIYLCQRSVDFYHEFSANKRDYHLYKKIVNLDKTPKHVTVLLGNECPTFQDLSNLVMWCLAAGIPFISFYDYTGNLSKHRTTLEAEIDKKKLKDCSVIWHNDPTVGYKNGYSGRKIHVKLITSFDGKKCIVDLCKDLAMSEFEDYSVETIHNCLQKQFEFPLPDLGLYFGDTLCMYNYPPWQIHITEFISLKARRDLKLQTFVDVLLQYSKCEQRLGK